MLLTAGGTACSADQPDPAPPTSTAAPAAPGSPAGSAGQTPTPTPTPTAAGSAGATGGATSPPSGGRSTPTPGSVTETVAPRTQSTRPAVGLDRSTRVADSLAASVGAVRTEDVAARYPGEVSGPAVVFTLRLANRSAEPVALDNLVVNVLDASGAPASRITSPPAQPAPRQVGAGRTVRARYVFVVPPSTRRPLTIEVSVSADDPVAVFRGAV